jgi:hypothetical protein
VHHLLTPGCLAEAECPHGWGGRGFSLGEPTLGPGEKCGWVIGALVHANLTNNGIASLTTTIDGDEQQSPLRINLWPEPRISGSGGRRVVRGRDVAAGFPGMEFLSVIGGIA